MMHAKRVLMAAVAAVNSTGGNATAAADALRTGKQITAQYLDEFFNALENEKASPEVRARMQVFTESLLQMPQADVAKVLRDFASKDRHEKLAAQAGSLEEKQRILGSLYDVHRNRAKEARQIYGAVRFADLKIDGMGWSAAYEKARAALGQKEIKWDGTKAPTAAEQEANAGKRQGRKLAQEVKDAVQDLVNLGAEIKPAHYAEIAERAQASMAGRDAKRRAIQLVRGVGPEQADLILLALPEIIAVAKANGVAGLDKLAESLNSPIIGEIAKDVLTGSETVRVAAAAG